MNETEREVPGAGTNDRWRLDGRVALVTGASAGSYSYMTGQALVIDGGWTRYDLAGSYHCGRRPRRHAYGKFSLKCPRIRHQSGNIG